jgi:phage/plasmid-associated DNA primase
MPEPLNVDDLQQKLDSIGMTIPEEHEKLPVPAAGRLPESPTFVEVPINYRGDLSDDMARELANELQPDNEGTAIFVSCLLYDKLGWNEGRQQWYLWSGQIWESNASMKSVRSMILKVARSREPLMIESSPLSDRGTDSTIGNINAIIGTVQKYLEVDDSDFDLYDELHIFSNGTLDAKTNTWYEGIFEHEHRAISMWQFPYDLGTEDTAIIDKILQGWFSSEPELYSYVSLVLGYISQASQSEEKIVIGVGPPRAGKGTLSQWMRDVAPKGRTAVTPHSTLTMRSDDSDRDLFRRSDWGNKWSVWSEEGNEGELNTGLLNSLSADKDQRGRHPHGREFDMTFQAKIVALMNDTPKARANDFAFWGSRVLYLEFPYSYPKDKDIRLKDFIAQPELKYLFQCWLVDKILRWWQERPIVMPQAAQDALELARAAADPFDSWYEMRVREADPDAFVSNELLYQSYQECCEEYFPGQRIMDLPRFGGALKAQGLNPAKQTDPSTGVSNTYGRRGIELLRSFAR